MKLRQRSYQKEYLDNDDVPFSDIKKNMQELDIINTYLGGHSISIKGFKKLIAGKNNIHICEIGCGGGDNLLALLKWCNRNDVEVVFTGIDIKQSCVDYAKTKLLLADKTKWTVSDYRNVTFQQNPDIIFSSLFCHHFSFEELILQIQWMKRNSKIGFFINDLQRNRLAYFSIKLLTKIFSKSTLVKNDAPLSVARALIKKEWENIFTSAGIQGYQVQWCWAFRYLITYKNEGN